MNTVLMVPILYSKEEPQTHNHIGDFKSFLLEINLRLQEPLEVAIEDVHISFTDLNNKELIHSNFDLDKKNVPYSKGFSVSEEYPNHFRFYHIGNIRKFFPGRKDGLKITIEALGYRRRIIEVEVQDIQLLVNFNSQSYAGVIYCTQDRDYEEMFEIAEVPKSSSLFIAGSKVKKQDFINIYQGQNVLQILKDFVGRVGEK